MHDVWEQMGPLLMLKQRGKTGERRHTGDVMRDAPEAVRKNMEGKDVTKKIKKNIVVCVLLTV